MHLKVPQTDIHYGRAFVAAALMHLRDIEVELLIKSNDFIVVMTETSDCRSC